MITSRRIALGAILVLLAISAGLAKADSIAYTATGGSDFGTIDLNTGVYTQIGPMGHLLGGLGVGPDGLLYGGEYPSKTLYRVNPANGSLTAVGDGSYNYLLTGSTTSGLFGMDYSDSLYHLFSINPANGATTFIGTPILPTSGFSGMSTNSSALYVAVSGNLYTLDTSTGAATLLGATGNDIFGILGMVTVDNTLYGANYGFGGRDSRIDTLDTSTGAATHGPAQSSGNALWALAPILPQSAAAPLPATLAGGLALFGGLGLAFGVRYRKLARG